MSHNNEQDAAGATPWGEQVESRDGTSAMFEVFLSCTWSGMSNDPTQGLPPLESNTREDSLLTSS